MQYATNTELASYIAGTHRAPSIQLLIDWDNDGFGSPYANMASIAEQIVKEKQLSGNIPDELTFIEGHSVAQLTVKLSGRRLGDSYTVDELLEPWLSSSPFYNKNIYGIGIIYRHVYPLATGPLVIDQFVGVTRTFDIEDGVVTITALDLMSLLESSVTLRPIAVDYFSLLLGYSVDRQSFNSCWAIDQILRQCGLYQSPAPVQTSGTVTGYFCATLSGAWFSEANSSPNWTKILATISGLDEKFINGHYGVAANGTVTSRGQYEYTVEPAGEWTKGETQQMGGWVYGPQPCINNEIIICDVTPSGDAGAAGQLRMQLYLAATGVVRVQLQHFTGQSYNVTLTGPTIAVTDWHYIGVGLEWQTSTSGIKATFNIDGVITTATNATVLLQFTHYQAYSTVRLESNMPVQHVQWWKTSSTTLTWPKDPPSSNLISPQTVVSMGAIEQTQIPDIFMESGLKVISDVVSAELGVLHSTESGTILFKNWQQIQNERTDENTFYLSEDDVKSLKLHRRIDAFRSTVLTHTTTDVLLGQVFFKSDKAERFDTPALTIKHFNIGMQDVYRVVCAAPAFTNPWDTDGVTCGYHVTRISDGTIPPGIAVAVSVLNQRNLDVAVTNPNAFDVRLATSPDATPALNIIGYQLYKLEEQNSSYTLSGIVTEYGQDQLLDMPASAWRSHYATVVALDHSIVEAVSHPVPIIDPIEVRGDSRRQLNDTCIISTKKTGIIPSSVVGITQTYKKDSPLIDLLVLQPLQAPGLWVLDEDGFTELSETTVLG